MQLQDSIAIEYSSTRREISDFHWWCWRRGFWVIYLVVVIVAIFFELPLNEFRMTADVAIGAVTNAAVAIAIMIAWPQIRFKSQRRTLTVDASGIKTSIGKIADNIPWTKVASVSVVCDKIYIARTNKNGFAIPARAFRSADEREKFLDFVMQRIAPSRPKNLKP